MSQQLEHLVGSKSQFFPQRPSDNEVGVAITKDTSGQPLLIEVLSSVHGVTNEELSAPAYTMAIGQRGVQVQVRGRLCCLRP